MRQVILENTDLWNVTSHGNGLAYSFYHKPSESEGFLQGDDATQWRDDYSAMQEAYANPASAWHHKSWNACLSELCADYLQEVTQ